MHEPKKIALMKKIAAVSLCSRNLKGIVEDH